MTNASIKNVLFGISVLTVAAMLSLGAFATTVQAEGGWESYDSIGGTWDSFDSYSGGWDSYDSYAGGWDSYDTNGGWDSYDSYNGGWDSYDSYNPGYYETDTYNPGYYETDTYNPGYYETDSYNPGYYETDTYNPGYEYQQSVYQSAQGYQYSTGGGSQQSYHQSPMTVAPPTYRPQTPSYPTYPTYPTPRPQPTPTTPSYVTTTTNTCVNNSCNTSYVDNSINGSFNTAPIYQATPQPIIQYVQPIAAPYCVITIGQGYQTGMVSLSWSSTGATSAYITPNIGNVNVNGSTNIYAYGNAVYTLTVTGQGGTYTCRTQSYIAPQAPATPYVSLSQIPYTGFDFGTFGNAMYWLALLSFAVAGAYLVVYYQGGALALAGNMLGGNRSVSYSETTVESTPVETVVAPETHEAPVALFNLPTTSASSTKDVMTVSHTADGLPRIVITRA